MKRYALNVIGIAFVLTLLAAFAFVVSAENEKSDAMAEYAAQQGWEYDAEADCYVTPDLAYVYDVTEETQARISLTEEQLALPTDELLDAVIHSHFMRVEALNLTDDPIPLSEVQSGEYKPKEKSFEPFNGYRELVRRDDFIPVMEAYSKKLLEEGADTGSLEFETTAKILNTARAKNKIAAATTSTEAIRAVREAYSLGPNPAAPASVGSRSSSSESVRASCLANGISLVYKNGYHSGNKHYFVYDKICSVCGAWRGLYTLEMDCDGPPCTLVPPELS